MSNPTTSAERTSRSRAEWASFAIASAVLLAVAGAIGALWAQPSQPPDLTVTLIGEPRRTGPSTYLTAEVENHGTETAQDVQVVAEMTEAGEPVQVGEQVVTFLAGGASERVVFVIDARLQLNDLTLSVDSYTEP